MVHMFFSPHGRRGRLQHFLIDSGLVALISLLIAIPYLAYGLVPGPRMIDTNSTLFAAYRIALFVLAPILLWIGIVNRIKRFHDMDMTGWWALGLVGIPLIPYLGAFVALVMSLGLLIKPGNPFKNMYGEPPTFPRARRHA